MSSAVAERQAPAAAHSADARVRALVDEVLAELKRKRFGRRTIELIAVDGVIVRGEVTERVDSHKFV